MKIFNSFLLLLSLVSCSITSEAQRYLEPFFDDVSVQTGIVYGANYTIITVPSTGHSSLEYLKMDVYSPLGDTASERPLVLFLHDGFFLPNPQNGYTVGTRTDSFAVEMCTRLAKMGYVVASLDYRLGWNPISADIMVRKGTLIATLYRSVQDARSCIRYFRKTIEEEGNPYSICPDRITIMGEGAGGSIAIASASLDTYEDLVIPKFMGDDIDGDGIPDPMIIESINGDLNGETLIGLMPVNGDTLAIPNHPGYPSNVQLCVNFSGMMLDTSWLEADDPPFISFHVPHDPIYPYETGTWINDPGDVNFELHGSHLIAQLIHQYGNNQVFTDANIQDVFTIAANAKNDGFEGLFPFLRPVGTSPLNGSPTYEGSPWGWWDSTYWSQIAHPFCPISYPLSACNFHIINALNNPDMSAEKGKAYTDSIIGYLAPRAYAALNLAYSCGVNTLEIVDQRQTELIISPNPASSHIIIRSPDNHLLQTVRVYNLSGQMVKNMTEVNSREFLIDRDGLAKGMYIVKAGIRSGVFATGKVVFK